MFSVLNLGVLYSWHIVKLFSDIETLLVQLTGQDKTLFEHKTFSKVTVVYQANHVTCKKRNYTPFN